VSFSSAAASRGTAVMRPDFSKLGR
jgi:hypothetical protein